MRTWSFVYFTKNAHELEGEKIVLQVNIKDKKYAVLVQPYGDKLEELIYAIDLIKQQLLHIIEANK